MKCNLCGCSEFVDMNSRKAIKCKNCGSLERTRLLWLYIERLPLNSNSRVLHLAPEKGIYTRLSEKLAAHNYITADYDPGRYAFVERCNKIDLTNMEDWPSNYFDLILHVHVMEHIPCNIAYPLFHLHRMMKRDGVHLCVIPFLGGVYDECFDNMSAGERTRRFGQYDHVRKFGRDGLSTHLGKIINLPTKFDATDDFSESVLSEANIPKSHWKGFHVGTVLSLKKDDYKLNLRLPASGTF